MPDEPAPTDAAGAAAAPESGPSGSRPRRRDLQRGRRRRRRARDTPVAGERTSEGPGGERPRRSRRRGSGRRGAVIRRRRRRRVRRAVLVVVLALLGATALAALAWFAAPGLLDRTRDLLAPTPEDEEVAEPVGPEAMRSVVLVAADGERATPSAVAVLGYDEQADEGTVLLVPAGAVAEVPGHGTFTVGDAHAFGGGALVWITVDNLLGTAVGGVTTVAPEGWEALAEALGGFDVDVDVELAPREGETEVERLPRVRGVVDRLLAAIAADGAALEGLVAPDGALATPDVALVRDLLVDLADAAARDRVSALTLPVSPLGSGQEDVYRVDAEAVDQLVEDRFAPIRTDVASGAGARLQVLNGVGVPGIGQDVAERLRPGGHRVVLTGNADHFEYGTTLIVVYDDDAETVAAAEHIRDLLGVGEIERSTTPQSVVDVTVVVGADFLERE